MLDTHYALCQPLIPFSVLLKCLAKGKTLQKKPQEAPLIALCVCAGSIWVTAMSNTDLLRMVAWIYERALRVHRLTSSRLFTLVFQRLKSTALHRCHRRRDALQCAWKLPSCQNDDNNFIVKCRKSSRIMLKKF